MPGGRSTASGAASNAVFRSRGLAPRFVAGAGDQHEELVAAPPEDVVGFADVPLAGSAPRTAARDRPPRGRAHR